MISPYLKSRFSDTIFEILVLSRSLFRGMVRNGIPTVCFFICSMERNSEIFSLPLKGSEGNSESMLLFLFPRNGIPSCFLFRGRVRNGIPRFFVPRNSRNSVGNSHLFRLFRLPRNYFFVGNSQPYARMDDDSKESCKQRKRSSEKVAL